MAGLAFDAAATNALGNADRAASTAQGALAFFESGAAGYHEALEEANEDLYHRFEDEALGSVISAANDGGDVYAAAKTFYGAAIESVTAIVGSSGGGETGAGAASVVSDVFATFENAAVHDKLENADAEASKLRPHERLCRRLRERVDRRRERVRKRRPDRFFRRRWRCRQRPERFRRPRRRGVRGDRVVTVRRPERRRRRSRGRRPRRRHAGCGVRARGTHRQRRRHGRLESAGGDAHNVVAYEEELPDDATYWASGGFDSESAAREGWENGDGAVQSGQTYVHTFETPASTVLLQPARGRRHGQAPSSSTSNHALVLGKPKNRNCYYILG